MRVLQKIEGIIFYALIFSISLQVGKHFWLDFSFVNGVRVDYLSPTLYLSDIFIFFLFLFSLIFYFKNLKSFLGKSILLPLLLISLLASSIFSESQGASFYWSLKLIEAIFFGWYVFNFQFKEGKILKLFDIIIFAAIVQSIIAIVQFISQSSIGGPLYYLGERDFNAYTPGVATYFSFGRELLRPYGTFPHPNVLALFISIALILVSSVIQKISRFRFYYYAISLLFLFPALLLTSSRLIILLTLVIIFVSYMKSKKNIYYIIAVFLLMIPFYFLFFSDRLLLTSLMEAIKIRFEFIAVYLEIIKNNLLFGVGLNNYFFKSENYVLPFFARFQPAHNIYLLIVAQVGIFGGIVVFVFLLKLLKRLIYLFSIKKFPSYIFAIIMAEIICIGFFDHFIITLQQGILMTSLIIGLLFKNTKELV